MLAEKGWFANVFEGKICVNCTDHQAKTEHNNIFCHPFIAETYDKYYKIGLHAKFGI